jgi:hypothetical protein
MPGSFGFDDRPSCDAEGAIGARSGMVPGMAAGYDVRRAGQARRSARGPVEFGPLEAILRVRCRRFRQSCVWRGGTAGSRSMRGRAA